MKLLPVLLFFLFLMSCKDCKNIGDQDKQFLSIAGSAGIMEVEMGKLAIQKATRPELKTFGEMMVKEHTSLKITLKFAIKFVLSRQLL